MAMNSPDDLFALFTQAKLDITKTLDYGVLLQTSYRRFSSPIELLLVMCKSFLGIYSKIDWRKQPFFPQSDSLDSDSFSRGQSHNMFGCFKL